MGPSRLIDDLELFSALMDFEATDEHQKIIRSLLGEMVPISNGV